MKDFEKTKAEIIRRGEIMRVERKARTRRIAAVSAVAAALALAAGITAFAVSRTSQPTAPSNAVENADTTAPQAIDAPEAVGSGVLENDPGTNDDQNPKGGGSGPRNCGRHNPAYHMADIDFYLFLETERGSNPHETMDEVNEWLDGLANNGAVPECQRPDENILNFIEHFNVTREEFADYLARYYNCTRYDYDLDAIFGDDTDALNEWIEMSEADSASRVPYKQKNVFRFCKASLLNSVIWSDKYFDKWQDYFVSTATDEFVDYVPDQNPDRIPADEVKTLLPIDPYDEAERAVSDYSFIPRSDFGGIDPFGSAYDYLSVAQIVRDIGLTKEDAEYYFNVGYATALDEHGDLYTDTSDCWRVDFDKLFSDLDYYADLLGTPGFEYAYQVDELYLIKD